MLFGTAHAILLNNLSTRENMQHTYFPILFLPLASCFTATAATPEENETENNEETDETDDETEEVEEEEIIGTPVTFSLTGAEGSKIGLVRVVFGDDGPEFTDATTLSSELGSESTFTFGVETPDASELSALIPEDDTAIGMWAPFLFQDSNGDDVYNDGETINGFTLTWLVYATEDIPDYNVTAGWGALEMTFTEESSTPGYLDDIPLNGNLTPVDSLTIGGSYDTSLGDRRIAFVASDTEDETDFPLRMYDEVINDPWTITFSGTPSDEYFMNDEDGAQMIVASAMVYVDVNDNDSLDMADVYTSLVTVCNESSGAPQPIAVMYTLPQTDLTTAMYAGMYGLNPGWSIMSSNDSEPYFLSDSERNNLVISENCVFQ